MSSNKLLSKLVGNNNSLLNRNENTRLIHFLISNGKSIKLNKPSLENEIECSICNCKEGYVCINEPKVSSELCWFCSNPECLSLSSDLSKFSEKKKWYDKMQKVWNKDNTHPFNAKNWHFEGYAVVYNDSTNTNIA
jgi:hypothetical protein